MVRIEDARAHCERARAAGATILAEPTDHMYRERQYSAEDLAGHQWTFTESIADVAPEEDGSTTVEAWDHQLARRPRKPHSGWDPPERRRPR